MSRTYRRMDKYVEDISHYLLGNVPPVHQDGKWKQKYEDNRLMKSIHKSRARTERRIVNILLKLDLETWDSLVYKKDKRLWFPNYLGIW